MHTVLALEHAVGIGALDHHGSALDARFIAVQHVQNFHRVAVGVGPAGVHAVEHLGPVLGFGAAGTGMEGQNGVGVIVFAVEHGHQLQFVDSLFHPVDGFLALGHQRRIVFFLDHLQQGARFLILGGQLAVALQLVLQLAHLGVDLLAALLIIEKAGHGHLVFQLRQTLFAGFNGQRVPQVVDGGLEAAQFGFQFVNGDHISIPLVL